MNLFMGGDVKRIIGLAALASACGVPRQPIDQFQLMELMRLGQKPLNIQQRIESTMTMSDQTSGVYQLATIQDDPSRIYRVSYDLRLNQSVDDSFEDHCLKVATQQLGIMQEAMGELVPIKTQNFADNLQVISFGRKIGNVDVKGAYLDCRFAKYQGNWKLHSMINKTFDHLPVDLQVGLRQDDLDQLFSKQVQIKNQRREFLPTEDGIRSVTVVDYKQGAYEAAISLDNGTGKPLMASPKHLSANHNILMSKVYRRSYLDSTDFHSPLPLTPIYFSKGSALTSADGHFFTDSIAKSIALDSQRVRLFHKESSSPMRIDNFSQYDNQITIDEQGIGQVAVNTYAAVHRINKFVRQFLSPKDVPFLDHPLEVRVNLDGTCNAYYTTGRKVISLFSAGDGCANIGEVNDVIYHEWGHALDEHTGRSLGVLDGAFSEGLADFLAALYNDDPNIGIGFVQDADYGIRSLEDDIIYPDDVGEVHHEGGIIAGAFWDLFQLLIDRYGKRQGKEITASLFFNHLLVTDTYLESYDNVILLDDNDRNPATRSPNFCLINEAFSRHGLAEKVNCEDQSRAIPSSDSSLSLAIYDIDSKRVSIVGSSSQRERFSVCLGTRFECLFGDRVHLELPYLSANQERNFYAFQGPLTLAGVDLVTLLLKNPQGKILGSRTVKIVTK